MKFPMKKSYFAFLCLFIPGFYLLSCEKSNLFELKEKNKMKRLSKLVSHNKFYEKKTKKRKEMPLVKREREKKRKESFIRTYNNKSSLFFMKKMKISCDKLCEKEWGSYLEKKSILDHSKRVLSDLAFAHKEHGENQAYARIMALEAMRLSFKEEGLSFIEETILESFKNIEKNKKFKGYEYDLIDLLILWVELYGKKKLLLDPNILFFKFNYKPIFREIYADALSFLYPRISSHEKKSLLFREVLDNYGKVS